MFTITPMTLLPLLMILISTTLMLQRTHLLMALLLLETLVLTFVMMLPFMSSPPSIFFTIVLLTFGACEASLGLSILVAMTRHYGSDMIKSLSINKC